MVHEREIVCRVEGEEVAEMTSFEDYLELSDADVQHEIELSRKDFEAGLIEDADELSKELREIATKAPARS